MAEENTGQMSSKQSAKKDPSYAIPRTIERIKQLQARAVDPDVSDKTRANATRRIKTLGLHLDFIRVKDAMLKHAQSEAEERKAREEAAGE